MTYTVTLVNFGNAPKDAVHAAEALFRSELDTLLGEHLMPTLKVLQVVSEPKFRRLTNTELALIALWETAYHQAKAAGLRGLGDADGASFKVRPA